MTAVRSPVPVSLCDACLHQQLVGNTRGSVFSLCKRHRTEPELYRKYPRLPVIACPGFEPCAESASAPVDPVETIE